MTITVKTPSTFARSGGHNIICGIFTPSGHGATSKLYAHGGIGSGGVYDGSHRELERYNPDTDTWTTLASSIQAQRQTAWRLGQTGDITYVTGLVEFPGLYTSTSHGEYYDPIANTWTAIASLPDNQGRRRALFWTDNFGELNVTSGLSSGDPSTDRPAGYAGGQEPGDNGLSILGDWWTFPGGPGIPDPTDWTARPSTGFNPIEALVAPFGRTSPPVQVPVVTANAIWSTIIYDDAGVTHVRRVDPTGVLLFTDPLVASETSDWTDPFGSQFTAPFVGGGGAFEYNPTDAQLYLAGGLGYAFSVGQVSCWTYNLLANTWARIADLPVRTAYATLVWFGGSMYCIGGINPNVTALNTILIYNPIANAWLDTGDRLSVARSQVAAVLGVNGDGFWLYSGNSAPGPFDIGFTNVLEWWEPTGAAHGSGTAVANVGLGTTLLKRLGRAYAQVIGAAF